MKTQLATPCLPQLTRSARYQKYTTLYGPTKARSILEKDKTPIGHFNPFGELITPFNPWDQPPTKSELAQIKSRQTFWRYYGFITSALLLLIYLISWTAPSISHLLESPSDHSIQQFDSSQLS